MDGKKAKVICRILVAMGVILILAMAFDLVPGMGNVLLFLAISCFIIAGAVKAIAKKQ